MQSSHDVIVLGAGIIGACIAYETSKAGLKTLVIDRHPLGTGASGNSAAMLECQLDAHRGEPFLSLAKASDRLFPALHSEVKALTGIDFELEKSGILQLAFSELEVSELNEERKRQTAVGLSCEWLNAEAVRQQFPQLTARATGGLIYKNDGQVDGKKFLEAMSEAAKKTGAEILVDPSPAKVSFNGSRRVSVRIGNQTLEGGWVVLACGAWTDQLLEPLGVKLGIEPVRGQLLVQKTEKRPLEIPVYTRSQGYIAPKKNGYALVGTTVEYVGFNSSVTPEARRKLLAIASDLLPVLKDCPVTGMTAGLRPKSADDLPFLGPVPGYQNLAVASGHYRNGVLLAPITGKLIASFLAGQKPPLNPAPFFPARLQGKFTAKR